MQAPHLPKGIALAHRASGYADILLSQGWFDRSALWGLVQAWLNAFAMFRPDRIVLDYSPTACLAARIAGIPVSLIGNGFEIPPQTDPLPCFPGFSWATQEKAAVSERACVENANGVLQAFRKSPINSLCSLTRATQKFFVTFPDLDHYEKREGETYIGPILGRIRAPRVEWPQADGPKIFACLRPDTANVKFVLEALFNSEARVVCVASGFDRKALRPFVNEKMRISLGPVQLDSLLDADLCVSYGAEGTMMRFLLAGVPQLISPWHVETYMAARRIKECGFGKSISTPNWQEEIANVLQRGKDAFSIKGRLSSFASLQINVLSRQLMNDRAVTAERASKAA